MKELGTNTIKYYRLAIDEFLPQLNKLKNDNKNNPVILEEISDIIEMYSDLAKKIDEYNLILDDPNTFYGGEPNRIPINLDEKVIEYFSRLSIRLLESWKKRKEKIENKLYRKEEDKEELFKLKRLIWPLESQLNSKNRLFFKYKEKGAVEFPGENISSTNNLTPLEMKNIFSKDLIKKLPKDIRILCNEFNFNYQNKKPNSCILLLRRILPLSIVRKFQLLDKEKEILKDGEYLNTKELLGKSKNISKAKRIYKEVANYKSLLDASQHSYTLNIDMTDLEGASIKIRLLLGDLFVETE